MEEGATEVNYSVISKIHTYKCMCKCKGRLFENIENMMQELNSYYYLFPVPILKIYNYVAL